MDMLEAVTALFLALRGCSTPDGHLEHHHYWKDLVLDRDRIAFEPETEDFDWQHLYYKIDVEAYVLIDALLACSVLDPSHFAFWLTGDTDDQVNEGDSITIPTGDTQQLGIAARMYYHMIRYSIESKPDFAPFKAFSKIDGGVELFTDLLHSIFKMRFHQVAILATFGLGGISLYETQLRLLRALADDPLPDRSAGEL